MGPSRVRAKTIVHMHAGMQAIPRLQALGVRLEDFLPIECSTSDVLRGFSAAGETLYPTIIVQLVLNTLTDQASFTINSATPNSRRGNGALIVRQYQINWDHR
jgi:hypothetical protein